MVFTNAQPFPYIIPQAANITPFTVTDGTTYLSQLEQMRQWLNESLVPSFNEGIDNAIAEYQAAIGNAEAYVDEMITYINNKTGDVEVQRYTLNAPFTVSIDPQWPDNHPVNIVLTQNHIGAYPVTLGTGITGPLVVDPAPNSVTEFTLIPLGDDTWKVYQFSAIRKALEDATAAVAADLNELADLVADNDTRLDTVEAALPNKADKAKSVPLVTTFAELVAAVAAGGVVRVTDTPITLTARVDITTSTRIEGGRFTLPTDATYPGFRVTSSNVSFVGSKFSGAGTGTFMVDTARFIEAIGSESAYLEQVNISNVHMDGCQSDNIRYTFVRDSFIGAGTRIKNFLYSGIMLLSVEDTTVQGCVISDAVMKGSVVNVYGIALSDTTNVTATQSRNNKIIGNTVRNIVWEGIDAHGGENNLIEGNLVESCGRGIALVVGNVDRVTSPKNNVVNGNIVDKGSDVQTGKAGIGLFGLSSNFASGIISNNIVRGYEDDQAIYLSQYDARRTLVQGNSHPMIPWTALNMDNGTQWVANDTVPPQYMVDGRVVYLRGMVTPTGTQTTGTTRIAGIPTVARPGALTPYKQTRGANSASSTNATLAANPLGMIEMYYRNNTNDYYSYPIDGSYQRDYLSPL